VPVEIAIRTTKKEGNTYTNIYVNERLGDPDPSAKASEFRQRLPEGRRRPLLMKPSTEKVLVALRAAGGRGVSTGELLHGGCGSAMAPASPSCAAWAAKISTERIRQGSSRYILVREPAGFGADPTRGERTPARLPSAGNVVSPESSEPEGQLFNAEAFQPQPRHGPPPGGGVKPC